LDIHKQSFALPFDHHLIQGDILHSKQETNRLVLLHGAGLGTRDRYLDFRTCLAQRFISSLAFDFIGFGETGGTVGESSLQNRTEQACAVINEMNFQKPFSLLGASMGAYTAVKLLETYPIDSLILFVPAMYDIAAYSIPFGPEFTRIIRKPQSWVTSDAWKILQMFHGQLLLITAEQDDIIPHDVIRRIYEAASNASEREIYTVPKSPHLLIHYLAQSKQECNHVLKLVQSCVTGKTV